MSVTDRPVGDIVVLDVKGEMINNKEHGSVRRRISELLDRGQAFCLEDGDRSNAQ